MHMEGPRGLHALGQSLWLDDLNRSLLEEGTLARYIEDWAVSGVTSNPAIFDSAIGRTAVYNDQINRLLSARMGGQVRDPEAVFFELALADVVRAADLLAPVHHRTVGVDGWVSFEVSPTLAYDTRGTVEQAVWLRNKADRPNVFIKIPGTEAGTVAIEEAIYAGVPINVTLLFSPRQYLLAAEAYMRGLERRVEAGLDLDVRSVASVFVSRWDKAVAGGTPEGLSNRLGVAMAGLCYAAYRELMETDRWQRLANLGARPQRLLFASTSTKDPGASDVLYPEALAAPQTVITLPESTLRAFADHGKVRGLLTRTAEAHQEVVEAFVASGVDIEALAGRLQSEGVEAFAASWRHLMQTIADRMAEKPADQENRRSR